MPVKRINACIDERLWKHAVMTSVSWSRAIELGIELLLGENRGEKKLKEEKKELEARLAYIKKCLDEIEEKHKSEEETNKLILKNIELLRKSVEVFDKNINRLKGRTRLWNNTTQMNLTQSEFLQLCNRYKNGEFGVNK